MPVRQEGVTGGGGDAATPWCIPEPVPGRDGERAWPWRRLAEGPFLLGDHGHRRWRHRAGCRVGHRGSRGGDERGRADPRFISAGPWRGRPFREYELPAGTAQRRSDRPVRNSRMSELPRGEQGSDGQLHGALRWQGSSLPLPDEREKGGCRERRAGGGASRASRRHGPHDGAPRESGHPVAYSWFANCGQKVPVTSTTGVSRFAASYKGRWSIRAFGWTVPTPFPWSSRAVPWDRRRRWI